MNKNTQYKTILHVSLDSFFVSVERALNPELRRKPVIVGGNPKTNGIVACASYEARHFGVQSSMPLRKAYELVPHAVYVPGSFHHYQKFSEQFYKILSQFSDIVEPISLDEAYIDLTENVHNWISPEHAAKDMQNKIMRDLEITSSIGISSNKICSLVAARSNKPSGVVYVSRGTEKQFLAPLPVNLLSCIGVRTEKALRNIGIRTIGQLASVPERALVQMFGHQGKNIWCYANGFDSRAVTTPGQSHSVSRSKTFKNNTNDRRFIMLTGYALLSRACIHLREINKLGKTIVVQVQCADGSFKTRQETIEYATNNERELYAVSQNLLDSLLKEYVTVRMIRVGILKLSRKSQQINLFENSFFNLKQIRNAIERVGNRFGFDLQRTPNYRMLDMSSAYVSK